MFTSLKNELKTEKVKSGYVAMQLTESLLAINEAQVSLSQASDVMLDDVNRACTMLDELDKMAKTIELVQKTKLQPSACSVFATMEGFDVVSGIDLNEVTKENRNAMTLAATESMKEKASNAWKWLVEFFKKLGVKIKEFFLGLFDANRRQIAAVVKVKEGILTKIKEVDAEKFATDTITGLTYGGFRTSLDTLMKIITALAAAGSDIVKTDLSGKFSVLNWGLFGKAVEDGKLVAKGEPTLKREKKTLKDLAWTPDNVAGELADVEKLLKGVATMKTVQSSVDVAVKNMVALCSKLEVAKDGAAAGEKEKVDIAKKNLMLFTQASAIVASQTSALVSQYLGLCGKLKIKKAEKKKEE